MIENKQENPQTIDLIQNSERDKNRTKVLYKFMQVIATFTQTSQFEVDNPDQHLLLAFIRFWFQRKLYSDDKRLILKIKNCELPKDIVAEMFELYPSIIVFFNDEKIENNTLIKCQNSIYYEGKTDSMFIYYNLTGANYMGCVNNLIDCLPHGQGTKTQRPNTKEQAIYQGNFILGKKQGFGIQYKKGVTYCGQWENDEKCGYGEEVVNRKKKKRDNRQGYVQADQSEILSKYHTDRSTKQSNQTQDNTSIKNNKQTSQNKQQQIKQKEQEQEQEEIKEKGDQEQEIKQKTQDSEKKQNQNDDPLSPQLNKWKSGYTPQQIKQKLKEYKVIYVGPFDRGVKSGEIGHQYTKYSSYIGSWKDGAKNGKGVMKYKSGAIYEGEWKNNLLEGQGRYEDQAHNVYEGLFEGGQFDGQGTMKYANGDQYCGMWSEGRKHGQGVYTYSDGQFYDGRWVKDAAEGQGKSMTNGIYYEGEFSKGMKHGIGEETDEDGNVTKGIWKNNILFQTISRNGETI